MKMISAGKKGRKMRTKCSTAPVRGIMHNVVVVKPPGSIFEQAVFILRDDYFNSPGVSREELLTQAKRAAEKYTASAAPDLKKHSPVPALLIAASVLLLAGLVMLSLTGTI
ncbi:MAG: hypothetical protein ACOX68_04930 [Candidatus Limivicinus sp.]|jgi:hypothetical protein